LSSFSQTLIDSRFIIDRKIRFFSYFVWPLSFLKLSLF